METKETKDKTQVQPHPLTLELPSPEKLAEINEIRRLRGLPVLTPEQIIASRLGQKI